MQKPELLRIKSYLDAIVGERNPFSSPDQLKRCGDYIADQFRRFQLTVSSEPVPFEAGSSDNILGYQMGTESDLDPFVLAAHYDTVEGSPGADDNASAVATLLEIAYCLQPVP